MATFTDTFDEAGALAIAQLVAIIRDKSTGIRERLAAATTLLRFRHAERTRPRPIRAAHPTCPTRPIPPTDHSRQQTASQPADAAPSVSSLLKQAKEKLSGRYSQNLSTRIMQARAEAEAHRRETALAQRQSTNPPRPDS